MAINVKKKKVFCCLLKLVSGKMSWQHKASPIFVAHLFSIFSFYLKKKRIGNISKDQSNENRQTLFIQRCYSKEVGHHHSCFGRDTREVKIVRKLYRWKNREGLKYAMIRGYCHGEGVGKLGRNEVFYVIM